MAAMYTSDQGAALIKHYEGFKPNAYLCPAGVWTIGYGTTKSVKPGQCVTLHEAETMLYSDVAKFEAAVNDAVTVELMQHEFDALVCFTYNVGAGAFRGSTLLKMLNQSNYSAVPAQLMRWNKANGKVLPGLTKRRQSEGVLFAQGVVQFF